MHVQRGLLYLVCVYVCACLMPYFLDTVSLYVKMEVPTASEQHRAEFYGKGLSFEHFVQKLWHHSLTVSSYEDTAATFHTFL